MSTQRDRLHIAVGVILDQAADKVLVARRPEHLHLGGMLEFPGGKLDPGEHARDALARELREELNINVTRARPLIQINHDYAKESVLLDVWLVTGWSGIAEGMEDQEIMWLHKDSLSKNEFPQANQPIITAVNLPMIYGITPNLPDYDDKFFASLAGILDSGLKLLQFRSKELDEVSKHRVLGKIYEMCCDYNCRLLINGIAGKAMLKFAHGVHLTGRDLMSIEQRPVGEDYLLHRGHRFSQHGGEQEPLLYKLVFGFRHRERGRFRLGRMDGSAVNASPPGTDPCGRRNARLLL